MRSPITGTAAGVPFTALPPAGDGAAPLIVTWHMLDAPMSNAAFAAARMRSVLTLFPGDYPYDAESEKAVDDLDFVAKAGAIASRAPLLVVSGELDHPPLRADALRLANALGKRSELLSIPGLAHPLADEPGIDPAPQLPLARQVDSGLTAWFQSHLASACEGS